MQGCAAPMIEKVKFKRRTISEVELQGQLNPCFQLSLRYKRKVSSYPSILFHLLYYHSTIKSIFDMSQPHQDKAADSEFEFLKEDVFEYGSPKDIPTPNNFDNSTPPLATEKTERETEDSTQSSQL